MRTGHLKTRATRPRRAPSALIAAALICFATASQALAAPPSHVRTPSQDITGLNHACGVTTDSKGDLYASSAGEGKVKVFNPAHTLLTQISNSNTPCALAITTTGSLYVTEQATGNVIRYAPNEYPPTASTTYTPTTIDASGNAKGIAVDPVDSRLYVAEGTHIALYKADGGFEANLLEGKVGEATGVAAYTYVAAKPSRSPYLFLSVADAEGDEVEIFSGTSVATLKPRRSVAGVDADRDPETSDQEFGFGAEGAYLAADPGNEEAATHKCKQVSGQACTAGHLFLYDAAHEALDELDATGEFVEQTTSASFVDAEPIQVAVDRSGGAGDGTIYVSAGASTGAKALAFGPLGYPSRSPVPSLSHVLAKAIAVATDEHGDAYAAAETQVHVYGPAGSELTSFEDAGTGNAKDLAVDSQCNVYVVDGKPESSEQQLTYYHPSSCPPTPTTTYARHEPALIDPGEGMIAVAVNPADDHVFVLGTSATVFPSVIQEFDSAADGSGALGECGASLGLEGTRTDIDVYGKTGEVFVGSNLAGRHLYALQCGSEPEIVREFKGGGCPSGEYGANPAIAVDQANGHVLEYSNNQPGNTARENEASGACTTEFGAFSPNSGGYRVAVDNSCALHDPPLTEQTTPTCASFDPANGTAYVAFDSNNNAVQPYDVTALGPLGYAPPAEHQLTVTRTGKGSGEVESSPAGIDCGATCSHKFPETETVTLTATPDPGSEFLGWGAGQCEAQTVSPTEGTCELAVAEEDRTVKAEFAPLAGGSEFALTVLPEGVGSGEVSSLPEGIECPATCSAEFGELVKVTLTAKADLGSEVVGWEGCEAETVSVHEGTCTVTMSEAKEVKVKLGVEHPLLAVVRKGGGSGSVSSSPAGIQCPATCSHKFDLNEAVTLGATAAEGSVFAGWGGACAGKEPSCEVTMTEAREATATFEALPVVEAQQALPVGYDEATLRGTVDPADAATKYHFEYLTEAEYEAAGGSFAGAQSTPQGELAGKGAVAVKASLTGLKEGTAYRFRLLAESAVGAVSDEGPPFETLLRPQPQSCPNAEYRTGLSTFLPDCRAYELVTPAETRGALPVAQTLGGSEPYANSWFVAPRGQDAGESVGYVAGGANLPGFDGTGAGDAFRAQRGAGAHPPGGWTSELTGLSFAQSGGTVPGRHGVSPEQRYWLLDVLAIETPSEEQFALGTYLRTPPGGADPACHPPKGDPGLSFEAVGCVTDPETEALTIDPDAQGRFLSPGGAHLIFSSDRQLQGGAAPEGTEAIYDRAAGSSDAETISVKPDGSPFGAGEGATYVAATEDGSAVVFKAGGNLYVHREGHTAEIAEAPNAFDGISTDGTRVFYMDETLPTNNDPPPPAGLHACDVEAGSGCAGAGAHAPIDIAPESVFVNVSPDGSHALFTSEEALPGSEPNENGEHAEAGKHNLYAWDGSQVSFVAILATADFDGFQDENPLKEKQETIDAWTRAIPGLRIPGAGGTRGRASSPTRSTPDGAATIFQSHAKLSAYDNEGHGEIYRYAPAAPAGERLLCVSCDPSGAPAGYDDLLQTFQPYGATNPDTLIANVTDDGTRIFFQSRDRLVPADANSTTDVYEWKAKGTEGPGGDVCEEPRGCLALISSGQGEKPSYLYGMSADGHDVVFATQEKLVGQDLPGSPSLYDARIEGGIPDPPVAAPCEGDACQGQGSAPPALPLPASTGAGGGNLPPAAPARCAKGRHRVKGRCVATRHHKRHKRSQHRKRRANHNRRSAR